MELWTGHRSHHACVPKSHPSPWPGDLRPQLPWAQLLASRLTQGESGPLVGVEEPPNWS